MSLNLTNIGIPVFPAKSKSPVVLFQKVKLSKIHSTCNFLDRRFFL